MSIQLLLLIVALVLDIVALTDSITNRALLCIEGAILLIIVVLILSNLR